MRTPAQQAAASANGTRSSIDALSLYLLAKVTVFKDESHKGFQELVRQHTLRIAPRDAVEETCSAIQSFPDDLGCLAHACGVPAGKNPRIQALRQTGKKRFDQTTPVGHTSSGPPAGPDGGPHCAPEPLSMRLRPHIPVLRTSAREPQKPPPPPSHGNPRKTHGNPRKTQENPRKTHRNPGKTRQLGGTAASSGRCVPANTPGRNGGVRCIRTHRPPQPRVPRALPEWRWLE